MPDIDDMVARRKDAGRQPIVRLGDGGALAERVGELPDDLVLERFDLVGNVGGVAGGGGKIVQGWVIPISKEWADCPANGPRCPAPVLRCNRHAARQGGDVRDDQIFWASFLADVTSPTMLFQIERV